MKNTKVILALSSILFCASAVVYAADPNTTAPVSNAPAPVAATPAPAPTTPPEPTSPAIPTVQTMGVVPAEAVPLTPKTEIMVMVAEAVKYAKEHGDEEAFKEFNRPDGPFNKPHTYIFAIDFKGNILAHAGDAEAVGKNHYDIKDSKGRSVVRALIEKARYGEGAWVSYFWKNPATQVEECKSSFVTTVDKKFVVGAGFHHPVDAKGKCDID